MTDQFPTILLIEDDQPTRELYQRELSRDYEVLACGSESDALSLLHDHSICAIVLEPALQSGQGWSFLATLRAMSETRATPIILCSTLDARRRGLELGATFCLIKPVLPVALRDIIRQAVRK